MVVEGTMAPHFFSDFMNKTYKYIAPPSRIQIDGITKSKKWPPTQQIYKVNADTTFATDRSPVSVLKLIAPGV
jgi:hypothetical protein